MKNEFLFVCLIILIALISSSSLLDFTYSGKGVVISKEFNFGVRTRFFEKDKIEFYKREEIGSCKFIIKLDSGKKIVDNRDCKHFNEGDRLKVSDNRRFFLPFDTYIVGVDILVPSNK